jgi:hypothetical protein
MANLIRSAKSGNDWTDNELIAYNITIASISPSEFFPTPDPSLDLIDPAILNSPAGATYPAISDVATEYLGYLNLAARATQENFINDFAAETLKLLGFNEHGTTVSTRYIIPLTICGEANHVAQTDVCLIHRPTFILLTRVVVISLPLFVPYLLCLFLRKVISFCNSPFSSLSHLASIDTTDRLSLFPIKSMC